MKKTILFLVTLFALKLTAIAQQQKEISIHCVFPKKLNAGDKVNLKVNVSHTLYKEQTGNLTLELIDAKTNKSVDGWFLNIFPFQYFTTIISFSQIPAPKFHQMQSTSQWNCTTYPQEQESRN